MTTSDPKDGCHLPVSFKLYFATLKKYYSPQPVSLDRHFVEYQSTLMNTSTVHRVLGFKKSITAVGGRCYYYNGDYSLCSELS